MLCPPEERTKNMGDVGDALALPYLEEHSIRRQVSRRKLRMRRACLMLLMLILLLELMWTKGRTRDLRKEDIGV